MLFISNKIRLAILHANDREMSVSFVHEFELKDIYLFSPMINKHCITTLPI